MRSLPAAVLTALILTSAAAVPPRYAWRFAAGDEALEQRIPVPEGFARVATESGTWAAWLRGLPVKPASAPVLLFTGAQKWRQDAHVAVIDIDVGKRNLQQCADAIMRLRGEWLFATGRKGDIAFNDTEGKRLRFSSRGDGGYASFRKYMDYVFAYAGTYSLERELKPVALAGIAVGDVFIRGGFPGHAVIVVDMAVNAQTGEKLMLLAQSYMPAQDIHVLKNPANESSPWYPASFEGALVTPEWTFPAGSLRRWPKD